MAESQKLIVNFGRNVSFRPQVIETPRTEDEVLEILKRHSGRKIRAIGRLHAWSEAPSGDDVIIDLRNLNEVKTERRDGGIWATIGAGCQIKRVLTELDRQAGATTPSVGLISEQALAGAMSTGTHGSGKHSLSHYAAEVRIAMYDPETGEPVIRTISEGPELRAARCSLGCLGVIVSIGLWARPKYNVEEHFLCHSTLEGVLKEEAEFPLQQFSVRGAGESNGSRTPARHGRAPPPLAAGIWQRRGLAGSGECHPHLRAAASRADAAALR